jgi:hypothetical protein
MLKAGRPCAICTSASTPSTSIPWNATVRTRATISAPPQLEMPAPPLMPLEFDPWPTPRDDGKAGTKAQPWRGCARLITAGTNLEGMMSGLLRKAWHSKRVAVVAYLLIGLAIAWKAYGSYELGRRSDELLAVLQERLRKESILPLFSLIEPDDPDAAYFCTIGPYGSADEVEPLDKVDFPWGSGWLKTSIPEGSVAIVILNEKLDVLRTFELNRYKLDGSDELGPGRCYQRQDEPALVRENKEGVTALVIQPKTTR